MATVPLTTQQLSATAATVEAFTTLAAANTYQVQNDGRTFLHFKNTGGTPAVVTLTPQQALRGLSLTAPTVSVPATTGDIMVGPFPTDVFNDASGNLNFATTNAPTVSVVRVPASS